MGSIIKVGLGLLLVYAGGRVGKRGLEGLEDLAKKKQ